MPTINDGGNQIESGQQSTHSWFENEAAHVDGAQADAGLTDDQDLNWVRDFDKHKAKQGTIHKYGDFKNVDNLNQNKKKKKFFTILYMKILNSI